MKARVGRKADEKLNVSHKEIFIISLGRGGYAQSQKSFWQLGKTNFQTKKATFVCEHYLVLTNVQCLLFGEDLLDHFFVAIAIHEAHRKSGSLASTMEVMH